MTEREVRARAWAGAACAVAQIAATASGMLPWWALPVTLTLTVLVARPPGPINPTRARATRSAGVACVAAFSGLIAFRAIAAGGVSTDPSSTLRSLTEALVILSLIMAPAATTAREHRVWLTVTTGVLVAAAAGGRTPTSSALNIGSWVLLLTAITKVQTTAAYADGSVTATVVDPPSRTRSSSLWRSDSLIPVLAALAAGTVVFYALPSGLGGGGLARRLATQVSGSHGVATENRDTVGVDTFGSGELSLLVRGSLPETPIMSVPLRSPALWRGTIYRAYTGTAWEDGFTNHFVSQDGPSTAVPLVPADPKPVGHTATYQVELVPTARTTLVWAPGVITHLSGPADAGMRVIRGDNNVRVLSTGLSSLSSYTVTSRIATTRPSRLGRSTGADPTDATWTQLPPGLPPAIGQLAQRVTAGSTTRAQQVRDIVAYLRSHETYSLNSPVPGPGQDAVADFLFRDHLGFCEQFASAEAVMLRTLGVPARVVTGLAYGIPSKTTRLFTAANAHAWVEVYFPGIGWSPSDPTAGARLAPIAVNHQSAFSRVMTAIADALPGGRLALGVAVAVLILLAGWLLRVVRGGPRRPRWRRRPAVGQPGPILAAFLRLIRDPKAPATRSDPETAREYLGRIGVEPQTDGVVETLEQEMYGADPPDPESAEAAIAALGALTGR